MSLVKNLASPSKSALDSAKYQSPALTQIIRTLQGGESAAIGILGDSTSAGTTTWQRLAAQAIGTQLPNIRIVERTCMEGTGTTWTETVVQEGANGAQGWNNAASGTPYAVVISGPLDLSGTADLDLRGALRVPAWSSFGSGLMLAQYAGAGNRTFWIEIYGSAGSTHGVQLQIWDSSDTNRQYTWANSIPVSSPLVANGERIWIRVTLDGDNGSGGSTARLYWSTDNATWTELGSAQTVAATITGYGTCTANFEALGRSSTAQLNGATIERAEVRKVIGGASIINPVAAYQWTHNYLSTTQTLVGSPTLWIINRSQAGDPMTGCLGQDFTKIVPNYGQSAYLVSFSYNDNLPTFATWMGNWDSMKTAITGRLPWASIVPVIQAPERTTNADYWAHQFRNQWTRTWAASKGQGMIDANAAFFADGRGLTTLVSSDEKHPTSTGYQVWANRAVQAFGLQP